jgi:hypothetical protein
MIQAAKAMTDESIRRGNCIDEVDALDPRRGGGHHSENAGCRQRVSSGADGGTDLGNRIVETPEDAPRFELRDPHSGFVAYVRGKPREGGAGVDGNKTLTCNVCHGADLNGLGGARDCRALAQLHHAAALGHPAGGRKGVWSPLMKQVVERLTADDMLNLAAYVSSLGR